MIGEGRDGANRLLKLHLFFILWGFVCGLRVGLALKIVFEVSDEIVSEKLHVRAIL